jgi:hypothetical protein
VRGVFEAGMHRDKAYGLSLFRVRQARVEEAVGAKIFGSCVTTVLDVVSSPDDRLSDRRTMR